MAKQKKKKHINADALNSKKSKIQQKKLNPFEIHINKEKFKILGRKCKHDRGLPGQSRSKGIKKRKQTLGKELQVLHKVNTFKDRRIGKGISNNDDDEIATARFTAEKMAQLKTKKSSIFNLNDDEVLTHRGQTLEEIEQFQDPESDLSDDDVLDAEFTEVAHFGGDDNKIDRKILIEEKILEAKRRKAEILKEKEEILEMTEQVDKTYKGVLPLLGKLQKTDNSQQMKSKPDDYDKVLKEMIFEPRGEVTDKLQSEEEIAKKEKQRLEKLEKERLKRMMGDENMENDNNKPKHKSADDLDDGYYIDGDKDEEEGAIAYSLDGKLGEDNSEVGSEDEKDNEEEMVEEEEELSSSSSSEEVDNLEDLKVTDTESSEDEELENNLIENNKQAPTNSNQDKNTVTSDELPYTYDVPQEYEDFKQQLQSQTPENQEIIVERTIKYNHPKLDPSNRVKSLQLFSYLLKYVEDIFHEANETNISNTFKIYKKLSQFISTLANSNPKTTECFQNFLKYKYNTYKKNQKRFPGLSTVVFFELISNVYSTSDFRHGVVTPSFIFISQILSQAKIRTRRDISLGLFIVTIFLEFTKLSKRILPAVYNYLLGIVFLCVEKKPVEIIKIIPPFSSKDQFRNILVLHEDKSTEDEIKEEVIKSTDFILTEIDDKYKIRCLNTTLNLIHDCITNIYDNVGVGYYAESFLTMLEKLDLSFYPKFVEQNYEKLISLLNKAINKPLKRLERLQKKPKCLRLLEPKIVKVYDDKRRPKLSKEKEERVKLLHKVKRETKSAAREIRRDTAFITKMQIKKQIQSDLERKEKVKRIYAEAAIQQGELNSLDRKRKKMK